MPGIPGQTTNPQWYNFPMDSPGGGYGEMRDPACSGSPNCYLKPDTNIQVPSGTPITSLFSGTVTSVKDQGGSDGGLSVVVRNDDPNAINSTATHVAYNFLGNSTVSVGQHVGKGQIVGTAGSPYGINFALALTPDDNWGGQSFGLNAKGDPRLDPRPLLLATRSGSPILPYGSITPASPDGNCAAWDFGCQLTNFFGSIGQQITNAGEKIAIFAIALTLVILGFYLMMHRQINEAAVHGGELAVLA
jgi:hypothetical protein